MAAARRIIEEWRIDYNYNRPHTSLRLASPRTSLQPGPDRTTRRTESSYERGLIGGNVRIYQELTLELRPLSFLVGVVGFVFGIPVELRYRGVGL